MGLSLSLMAKGCVAEAQYPVNAPGVNIQTGDFLWWDSTNLTLKPVGGSATGLYRTWSSEARARRDACARFAGISQFSFRSTDTPCIQTLRTAGYARVQVASSTYVRGNLLGFQKDAAGNYLYRTSLQKVTDPRDAIGWVVEDYSTATTEVAMYFVAARDFWANIIGMITVARIHMDATQYPAVTTPLTSYNWGFAARVFAAEAYVGVLTAGANVFTFKNAANAMDDTLTVPDAQAAGTVVRAAIDDANNYHNFEHDDAMNITCDSGATAGAADLAVLAMPRLAA